MLAPTTLEPCWRKLCSATHWQFKRVANSFRPKPCPNPAESDSDALNTHTHKHTHTHKARAHVSWQLTWSGCAGIISATRDRAPVDKPRGSASLMPLRLSPVLPSTCSLPVHFPHFPLLSSTPTRPLRRVWTHRRIKCESNAYRHT